MHPKQVELLASRLRRDGHVQVRDGALRHLDAARAKLDELREIRHRTAATLSRCVDERDAAVAALNKLKDARNEQARSVYYVQQAIIDDLRGDLEFAISALQDISDKLEHGRFSPNIFTRVAATARNALDRLSGRPSSQTGLR